MRAVGHEPSIAGVAEAYAGSSTRSSSTRTTPRPDPDGVPTTRLPTLMDAPRAARSVAARRPRLRRRTLARLMRGDRDPPGEAVRRREERLGDALAPDVRAALAAAMLADVLAGARPRGAARADVVVTGEPAARAAAERARRRRGRRPRRRRPFRRPRDRRRARAAAGAGCVALLPGDCPLLDAAELDRGARRRCARPVARHPRPPRHRDQRPAALPARRDRALLRPRQPRAPPRPGPPGGRRSDGSMALPSLALDLDTGDDLPSASRTRARRARPGAGDGDGAAGHRRRRNERRRSRPSPSRACPRSARASGSATLIADRSELATATSSSFAQKVVSKAEGRTARLADVEPGLAGRRARRSARQGPAPRRADPRREHGGSSASERVLIVETHSGLICANAGIDSSNAGPGADVVLLPADPDASARRLRAELRAAAGVGLAVVVTDSFGRPWRVGQADVAIGCAGIDPLARPARRARPRRPRAGGDRDRRRRRGRRRGRPGPRQGGRRARRGRPRARPPGHRGGRPRRGRPAAQPGRGPLPLTRSRGVRRSSERPNPRRDRT